MLLAKDQQPLVGLRNDIRNDVCYSWFIDNADRGMRMSFYTSAQIFSLSRMAVQCPETIQSNYDIAVALGSSPRLLDMAMCVEGIYKFLIGRATPCENAEDHPKAGMCDVYESRVSTLESVVVYVPWDETKTPFVEF